VELTLHIKKRWLLENLERFERDFNRMYGEEPKPGEEMLLIEQPCRFEEVTLLPRNFSISVHTGEVYACISGFLTKSTLRNLLEQLETWRRDIRLEAGEIVLDREGNAVFLAPREHYGKLAILVVLPELEF